jgi:hypothetical protein
MTVATGQPAQQRQACEQAAKLRDDAAFEQQEQGRRRLFGNVLFALWVDWHVFSLAVVAH